MGSGPTQKALNAMQRTYLQCDKGTESGRGAWVWKMHMPSASGSHSGKDFVYSLVLDFKGNSMRRQGALVTTSPHSRRVDSHGIST